MVIEYVLQIITTGEVLKRQKLSENELITMRRWQSTWQEKLLRYKKVKEEHKQAIRQGNVITGWSNFDDLSAVEKRAVYEYIFKDYDRYFESYYLKGQTDDLV